MALSDQPEPNILDFLIKMGQGITGSVALSGVPEVIDNTLLDRRVIPITGTFQEPEAVALAPLTIRQQVTGVMAMTRRGTERPFLDSDLDLLIARENPDKSTLVKNEGPYSIVGDTPVTDGDAEGRMELAQYLGGHGWLLSETLGFDPKTEPKRYDKLVLSKNITPDFPPTLIVHAKNDPAVPFAEAEKITKLFTEKRITHDFYFVEEGHSSQMYNQYPEVVERVVLFLDKFMK